MAGKDRIKSLGDVVTMKAILKRHVKDDPASSQLLWQYRSVEEVAEQYEGFFTAVATTGHILAKRSFLKAVKSMYEGDKGTLDAFAQCMVDTLKDIRLKFRSIKTGEKTPAAVKGICEAWASTAGSSPSAAEHEPPDPELAELFSSESESEGVVSLDDEPTEADAAKAALANAVALFGTVAAPPPMQRSLGKHDSIVSIGSSEPATPKAAAEVAKTPLKADNPFLSPQEPASIYRGSVAPLEVLTEGINPHEATTEMQAITYGGNPH